MAKDKTAYVCDNCGHESVKWIGKCPSCGQWNTFKEIRVAPSVSGGGKRLAVGGVVNTSSTRNTPMPISKVQAKDEPRIDLHDDELNRVLGGGLVRGSIVLLGGEPGIGKSTLVLQTILRMPEKRILYVSGEESTHQLKMRADRIEENVADNVIVLSENSLEKILMQVDDVKPDLLIVDSIQTIESEAIDSSPGSIVQVRECASALLRYAKTSSVPVLLIGHINKEGVLAGPKILEHIVDTVLQFEGDQHYMYRILRSIKNRFGSTSETGIFAMVEEGLQELSNPSASLLAERSDEESGSAVMIYLEGVRPILVEVQSLVVTTAFGMPRRTAIGYDLNRLIVLLAVLEKRCGFTLGNKDVYVNVIGGLKVNEPACDLSMAVAIVSNLKNRIVPTDMVILGEVGLTGNVRSIPRIEQRINEAKKLGFKKFIIPEGNYKQIKDNDSSIKIRGVKSIQEAMQLVFS